MGKLNYLSLRTQSNRIPHATANHLHAMIFHIDFGWQPLLPAPTDPELSEATITPHPAEGEGDDDGIRGFIHSAVTLSYLPTTTERVTHHTSPLYVTAAEWKSPQAICGEREKVS